MKWLIMIACVVVGVALYAVIRGVQGFVGYGEKKAENVSLATKLEVRDTGKEESPRGVVQVVETWPKWPGVAGPGGIYAVNRITTAGRVRELGRGVVKVESVAEDTVLTGQGLPMMGEIQVMGFVKVGRRVVTIVAKEGVYRLGEECSDGVVEEMGEAWVRVRRPDGGQMVMARRGVRGVDAVKAESQPVSTELPPKFSRGEGGSDPAQAGPVTP